MDPREVSALISFLRGVRVPQTVSNTVLQPYDGASFTRLERILRTRGSDTPDLMGVFAICVLRGITRDVLMEVPTAEVMSLVRHANLTIAEKMALCAALPQFRTAPVERPHYHVCRQVTNVAFRKRSCDVDPADDEYDDGQASPSGDSSGLWQSLSPDGEYSSRRVHIAPVRASRQSNRPKAGAILCSTCNPVEYARLVPAPPVSRRDTYAGAVLARGVHRPAIVSYPPKQPTAAITVDSSNTRPCINISLADDDDALSCSLSDLEFSISSRATVVEALDAIVDKNDGLIHRKAFVSWCCDVLEMDDPHHINITWQILLGHADCVSIGNIVSALEKQLKQQRRRFIRTSLAAFEVPTFPRQILKTTVVVALRHTSPVRRRQARALYDVFASTGVSTIRLQHLQSHMSSHPTMLFDFLPYLLRQVRPFVTRTSYVAFANFSGIGTSLFSPSESHLSM